MRKTLQELAAYLKKVVVPGTQEVYAVKPLFMNIAAEEKVREGIDAFRMFLYRLFDVLAAEGGIYDTTKKAAHEYENRTTLSVYYPFLHYVNTLLMKMGVHGALKENKTVLLCGNSVFNAKLSTSKNLECLRFLVDCGVCIDGVGLQDKKQKLSDVKSIKITYPDDPAMLTGLKVMAVAERELGSLVNQDIFLRCDYRALKDGDPDTIFILKDTIKPLSSDVQDFLLHLHERYLNQGLSCVVEIKGFHINIKYCYKRKDVFGINASFNNGYHVNVKATKTQKYPDLIKTFSPFLKQTIAKGYGCGRKREPVGHCDGGCRGMPIPLDNSVLDMRCDIERWFDQELSCLKGR